MSAKALRQQEVYLKKNLRPGWLEQVSKGKRTRKGGQGGEVCVAPCMGLLGPL